MDASVAAGYILESLSQEACIHVTNEHDGPLIIRKVENLD